MYSFVIGIKPKSYNSKKTLSYQAKLSTAFRESYPKHVPGPVETELYGLVYHFFKRDIGIDADNLSKPVWDALKGVVFIDDKQIKIRIAGSLDLITNDLTVLDFSGLPNDFIDSLLIATETDDHVLYVECGRFTTDIIRLNLERNGN